MRYRLMAALLVSALALAACGREVGGETADGAPQGGATGGGGGEAASPPDCAVDEVDGDLLLYNWSDYMDPDLLTQFSEQYGVTATEDTYTSNEALLAQIRAGSADYDVIVPSDYMVAIMIDEGLLTPLNKDAIPNSQNVSADFTSPPYDPELAYSMPYQWGTTGLGVNLTKTGPDPEPTWGWLFDPEMAGNLRISMLDDPREGMGAALYYLGYDPNTQDEAQLQEAADLIAQADWIRTFTSDQFSDLLLTGETDIGQGYSGNFLDNFGDDENYAYFIPEEGATIWTDNMAVLGSSDSPCTAHTFINFILDAENGAQLTNWTYYASPNEAATEFIDPEVRDNPAIYPTDEIREKLHFLENTGDAEVTYTELFTQAQQG